MLSGKILKPLDELIGYFYNTPVIVDPSPGVPLSLIMAEMKNIGGKVKGFYFGNTLRIELPLKSIKELSESKNIRKVRFDGDHKLLSGRFVGDESKLDKHLIELLSFLESTSIIVQTIDGLKEEDKIKVEELGGKIKYDLHSINSYSANLPLMKIGDLAKLSRVIRIEYGGQPLFGFTKMETM